MEEIEDIEIETAPPITDYVITNPAIDVQYCDDGKPSRVEYRNGKVVEYAYNENGVWAGMIVEASHN